jgi:hypothetical protein
MQLWWEESETKAARRLVSAGLSARGVRCFYETRPCRRLVQVNGYDVEVQVAIWEGTAENSVLCIHGLAANCSSWDTVCSALGIQDFFADALERQRDYLALSGLIDRPGLSKKPQTGLEIGHVRLKIREMGLAVRALIRF